MGLCPGLAKLHNHVACSLLPPCRAHQISSWIRLFARGIYNWNIKILEYENWERKYFFLFTFIEVTEYPEKSFYFPPFYFCLKSLGDFISVTSQSADNFCITFWNYYYLSICYFIFAKSDSGLYWTHRQYFDPTLDYLLLHCR